jgi:hypothetical protein
MALAGKEFFLMAGGRGYGWIRNGYCAPQVLPEGARLLTPPTTVTALAAGYRPVPHPRADTCSSKRPDDDE